MIAFVRTIWDELRRSLGEAFSLVRGDGVAGIDVGALTVRVLVSVLVLLLAWLAYGLARRVLAWTLRRTRFPESARGPLFLALRAVVAVLAVGLFARLQLTGEVLPPDVVMATYLVEMFGPLPRAIVVLGVLAAGFSTMEGILVALSSIFANDFLKSVLPERVTQAPDWKDRGVTYARYFLLALLPVTLYFSWQQLVDPSLSVAIFAQNGVYGLFAATFVPILAGIFLQRVSLPWVAAASLTALIVHFGMYYFQIGPYWNNPAVPATFALLASVAVMLVGWVFPGRRQPATAPVSPAADARVSVVAPPSGATASTSSKP